MSPDKPHKRGGRRMDRPPAHSRFKAYFVHHLRSLIASLGNLYRHPFSNLMTILVIGIALALPAGLYLALDNARSISSNWDGATQISLFTKLTTSNEQAREMADRIRLYAEIGQVSVLTREQSRDEFQKLAGYGEALDALKENPLPAVLIITPTDAHAHPDAARRLIQKLQQLPQTDIVQLDLEWVKRLFAIMDIAQRSILVVASLLAMAVLLVVGNTIRLDIQNRRDEIIITKQIGGTDAFIRRPFLYNGFWYGLFGGLIALLLVGSSVAWLRGPVENLSLLYQSGYSLRSLDLRSTATLLLIGTALGLGGSWLSVGRHLKELEPR